MNKRRSFLKLASAAAIPVAVAAFSGESLRADDGGGNQILGSWNSVHTLPFPPGSFREFLSFAEGGVMHETNSFLYTSSNVDFSSFGLPNVVNAADGVGNWECLRTGSIHVVFRKLLFDGTRANFGDLRVTGTLNVRHSKLTANWHIEVLNLSGDLLLDFGSATSEGVRLA